ncbi:hypothetical protein [Streptomyces hebeiensis]
MFEAAIREFGRVDAVLNVAGIASGEPLVDTSEETLDKVLPIDLRHRRQHPDRRAVRHRLP